MLSWVCVNSPSIDLFSYRTPGHGQKGHIRSVRTSVQTFSWTWLFTFFLELNMVLEAHVVLCMTEPDFLKIMFRHQNGENRPSPGFFEGIGKFSFFSQFFTFLSMKVIMKVYNESLYYCNCCMLEQISYLGKFWLLRYGPKCSWPIRIAGFSNQLQDSKIGCISQRR